MNFEKEQQAILAKAKELHVEATSLGSDQAPVLFVHDRIRLYEKLPFTSTQDNRQCLPYVNSRVMGVNPATIRMTDLRRLPGDQRPLSFWVQYLMAEITVLPVRAVILLGEKVANQFFQTLLNEETDEIENKIDALRRKRFMVPECDVSFFVAHDLKDIFAGPELTPLGFQWLEDVRAVFDSDVTYFKTEVLSATRKKND